MHYFIEKYKDKEIELFDKFVQKKISEKQLLIYLIIVRRLVMDIKKTSGYSGY